MSSIKNAKELFRKLFVIFSRKQIWEFVVYALLSMVGAFIEVMGLAVVLPLVQALIDPLKILESPFVGKIMIFLGISERISIIAFVCTCVVIVYLIKNSYLVFLSYYKQRFSITVRRDIAQRLLYSYFYRPYTFFLETNLSELIQSMGNDPGNIYIALDAISVMFSSFVTVGFIAVYIMITDVYMALTVLAIAGMCLIMVFFFFRRRMRIIGDTYRESCIELSNSYLQALQGIKEIKVCRRQEYFYNAYKSAWVRQKRSLIIQKMSEDCPQRMIEMICVVGMIAFLFLRIMVVSDATVYIPRFAVFAAAAFRVLPLLGTISGNYNSFLFVSASIDKVYQNMMEVDKYNKQVDVFVDCEGENKSAISLQDGVDIRGISWKYPDSENKVLDSMSLSIKKGDSIGIVGPSGAGKSTLVDAFLGLFKPLEGSIDVDGIDVYTIPVKWSQMVGYVPQTVYLLDSSIRNNVAFGVEEEDIEDELVWKALEQAQIAAFVRELPDGLDSSTGDRGIRLSGGQRQRIAIARALYSNPDILVFDEATSALDNETEAAVMDAIDRLQGIKTLIIVAHRLSTVKNCDKIYEIVNGKAKLKSKEEILGDSV